jgi:hypothetical protein
MKHLLLIIVLLLLCCCCFHLVQAQKLYPSNTDRHFRCPSISSKPIPSDYFPSNSNYNDNVVNNILDILPEVANFSNVALILIKRDQNGTPYFKYFGNGQENYAIETWSSSKIFGTMNAANTMKKQCATTSVGLSNYDFGQYGKTLLGDLITIIVTYVTNFTYSSNSLGGWFNVVGGRENNKNMVLKWLNCTSTSGQSCSLGANYGMTPPSDLQMKFYNPSSSSSSSSSCNITPDSYHNGNNANTLSALAAAEMLKRIVLARELPVDQRFPGVSYTEDIQYLLYGAENSIFFPNGKGWGGMSAVEPDLMRNQLNMTLIEQRSQGNWRTFGKDGGGVSTIRNVGKLTGEALYNGYACYPNLQDQDDDSSVAVEYIVSTRISIIGDDHAIQAYTETQELMGILNQAIFNGRVK